MEAVIFFFLAIKKLQCEYNDPPYTMPDTC